MAYTKEQFNQKVKDIYPNVEVISEYTKMREPIKARCNKCGYEWELKLASSLIKSGCPKCSLSKKGLQHRTKHEDFVNKLSLINSNIIPLETYIKAKDKIKFKCLICNNEWEARPDSILHGSGCPKCATQKNTESLRISKETFLKRVHTVNSNITVIDDYVNYNTKMKCFCNKHSVEFVSTAKTLMHGTYACPLCLREASIINLRISHDEFLSKLRKKELLIEPIEEYKGSHTKIKFKCLKCGHIRMAYPDNILRHGESCPKCLGHVTSLQDFIDQATIIHQDKYDYTKSIYTGRHNKLIITCPIHGDFELEAGVHLSGSGCPKCNTSKGEMKIDYILKNLNIEFTRQFKIKNNLYFPNKKFISADFYFIFDNLEYIIEYNGELHYTPIKYFGGEVKFLQLQERDANLRIYCEDNNIKLLEISYKEDLDNIEYIIKKFINYES